MTEHLASCSCGQLTLVARSDAIRVSMCHCLACQRRTGSTYGAQARFATQDLEITGESTVFMRTGDEGTAWNFHFCPRCGATVYWRMDADESFTAVPVGAFADPTFPPPVYSVYEERRHPWVSVPDGAEHVW